MYVYGECEQTGGGTDGGGSNGGDDDEWTYTNGGNLTGHTPGQPTNWVEPNSTGDGSAPNAPNPVCLNDIIHINDPGGTGGWTSTPIFTGGAGAGGDAPSSSDEGPCTPFPWVPYGVSPGTYTLFNPCFDQPLEPYEGPVTADPCEQARASANAAKALSENQIFKDAKIEIVAAGIDGNEHSITFGKTSGMVVQVEVV
jgi:hypothetical protein